MVGTDKRIRGRVVAAAASVALGVGLLASLGPVPSIASSHREAPLISADPQVDNTDVYAFVSPDRPNTVTLVSSWIPFEEPAGGPNFYPWAGGARYDIKIDNDGDALPDIIFRWVFTNHYRNEGTFLYNTGQVTSLDDPDLNFYQTYDLFRVTVGQGTAKLVDDAVSVPSNVGEASMPDFNALSDEGVVAFGSAPSYTWAGQSDDPFFLDLRVFDLLYGADLSEVGDDTLAGFNVNTIAVQVPKAVLAADHDVAENPIIGAWSTASRLNLSGRWVQVSRLGSPLVNEVVIPVGKKDRFNASRPSGDGQFLSHVVDPELPHLLNAVYGLPVPDSDGGMAGIQRDDLIQVFLSGVPGLTGPVGTPSEQLRLNMSIAPCTTCSTLGVIGGDTSGFPNGRRLSDDVIDIALQVVEGELIGSPNDLGDGVGANDVSFLSEFPYVAYAHSGSDATPH